MSKQQLEELRELFADRHEKDLLFALKKCKGDVSEAASFLFEHETFAHDDEQAPATQEEEPLENDDNEEVDVDDWLSQEDSQIVMLSEKQYKAKLTQLSTFDNQCLQFTPQSYWPNYASMIQKKFLGIQVTNIKVIGNHELIQRFRQYWYKRQNEQLIMCFHGSHPKAVDSIADRGFLIPGKTATIQVAHGSAHGVGIYLALNPLTSMAYCYGGNKMLCCAAIVGGKVKTKRSGSVLIAFEEESVLPCFVVTFVSNFSGQAPATLEEPLPTTKKTKKKSQQQ